MKDKSKFIPKYTKIKNSLLRDIQEHYKPGDLFYSQRELMQRFNASYATIGRVIKELKELAVISCHVGKGIFIEKLPDLYALKPVKIAIFIQHDIHADNMTMTGLYQQGIIDAQKKLPCEIMFLTASDSVDDMLKEFKLSQADGILFIEDKYYEMIERCNQEKIPNVVIHPRLRKHEFCVDIDDSTAMIDAITALIANGRKRIMLLGYGLQEGHNHIKYDACVLGLKMSGLAAEHLILHNIDKNDDLLTQINKITSAVHKEPCPDAVITLNQSFLKLLEAVIKHEKIKIPENMDIVSWGTHGYVNKFPYSLSKISVQYKEVAKLGIEILCRRCINRNLSSEIKLLSAKFEGLC